jgi:hypothetical protein
MVQSCFSICFVFRHRLSLVLLGHLKDPWSLDLLTEKSEQLTSRTTRLELGFRNYNAQFFSLGKVRFGCLGVVERQFGTSIFMRLVKTKCFCFRPTHCTPLTLMSSHWPSIRWHSKNFFSCWEVKMYLV